MAERMCLSDSECLPGQGNYFSLICYLVNFYILLYDYYTFPVY